MISHLIFKGTLLQYRYPAKIIAFSLLCRGLRHWAICFVMKFDIMKTQHQSVSDTHVTYTRYKWDRYGPNGSKRTHFPTGHVVYEYMYVPCVRHFNSQFHTLSNWHFASHLTPTETGILRPSHASFCYENCRHLTCNFVLLFLPALRASPTQWAFIRCHNSALSIFALWPFLLISGLSTVFFRRLHFSHFCLRFLGVNFQLFATLFSLASILNFSHSHAFTPLGLIRFAKWFDTMTAFLTLMLLH